MKKLLTLLTILVMCFLIGCKKSNPDTQRTLKVLLPSGTPVMAIGSLIGDSRFEFQIVNGQEPLQAALLEAKYDLIIAPFNLGAKLFLAGKSRYKVESIITTNNTYVISRTQINDVHDLENKKVMTFGKGSSPWLAYKAIDDKYNLNIQEVPQSSAGDVATLFANGSNDADFFLCAEPNITQLKEVNKLDVYTLNVSELLKEEASYLIQACLFVNPNSNVTASELKVIEDAINSMNANPKAYSENVSEKNDFFKRLGKEVIEKAIPNCNITYLKAKDNKKVIDDFSNLLNKYSPAVLNGKLMDENFYN